MKIAIVADVFPPLRSSGAVQLRDLAHEFVRQGHEPTMFVASPDIAQPALVEIVAGITVVRLRSPRTKDMGYARRALGEFLMPFVMLARLRRAAVSQASWDGVVWYSPTIFLGPFARALMKRSGCRGYLIVRDLFPDWAVDMGLMTRGVPYWVLKAVECYQYKVANVIGVQTPANLPHLIRHQCLPRRRIEVLNNWLADAPVGYCSIRIEQTPLAGRTILVYAGNMGVAQGMGILLELADRVRQRCDMGFLFVGRGSDALLLREQAVERRLDNVAFFDEIDPSEIPGLYAQCHAGIVALDPRHKTHNIPGKFLSYMQAGLPVLANINPGNDMAQLIIDERVGHVSVDGQLDTLEKKLRALIEDLRRDAKISDRCRQLARLMFSPETAVTQIVRALAT
jgi:glycosyltransferase involved in cell wall biosynthesis